MNSMYESFIGTTLADKYRIDSPMRETELGPVFHATHLSMEKPVAVKILSPALAVDENIVKRFSVEARRVSTVSHPNILNITDFGADANGTVYIVYEDAHGAPLKDAIGLHGKFATDHALGVARQIVSALSAAHAKGITHGGLTSTRILLTGDDDFVKVMDLGIQPADHEADGARNSEIEYLSPEQCADAASGDERSDIYSVGVLLYEMLAGEPPFRAESTSDLMLKHAQEPPPPLAAFRSDVPGAVETLILQTLAKNPEMRHQTATELFDDLIRAERAVETSIPVGAESAAAANNNIWKTAFVVLAGIALLSIFMIWATSSRQTDPGTMQSDANSQPVQPIGPATGADETRLATTVPITSDVISNTNGPLAMPDTLPGGDGYNAWGNGIQPPSGAPQYVPPGGGYYQVDPNSPSQFIPNEGSRIVQGPDGKYYYIVDEPANAANTNVKPSPKPGKTPPANTPVQPSPTPTSTENPQPTPVDPKPAQTKTPAPAEKPKTTPSTTKGTTSGKTQDSED